MHEEVPADENHKTPDEKPNEVKTKKKMPGIYYPIIALACIFGAGLLGEGLANIDPAIQNMSISGSVKKLEKQAIMLIEQYPDATYFALAAVDRADQEIAPPPGKDTPYRQVLLAPERTDKTGKTKAEKPLVRLFIGNSETEYQTTDVVFPEETYIQLIRDETHDKGEYTFRVWRHYDPDNISKIEYRKTT